MPQSFADQLRSIPMSPNLGQSLERAHRSARDQSHRLVTLEHLLLSLTEDAEAALILQSANVDLGRLATDVSGYLGRLLDDMRAEPGTEPRPDAELLRVLQAAASAAQQSRRKQIDGAIVLAAIVGDGKSPAAGLLKALGMTFEEAIRALQRANTKARLKPLAKPPAPAAAASKPAEGQAEAPPAAAAEPSTPEPSSLPAPDAAKPAAPAPNLPLTAQSADEILAAARARIQQRAASMARTQPSTPPRNAPAPTPPREPSLRDPADPDINLDIGPIDPAQTKSLTAAIEAAMASGSRGPAPTLPPTVPSLPAVEGPGSDAPEATGPLPGVATSPGRSAWIPPAEQAAPDSPAMRPPLPPSFGRAPSAPLPARPPPPPGEGPRRPPLPQRAGPPGQAQPGFPNRSLRAPWPEAGEPLGRPPLANGSLAEAPVQAPHGRERPEAALPPPGLPIPGPRSERALLAESVPRRMRLGKPAAAEVRVARGKVENLIAALNARSPQPADAAVARLLAVRLGAPQGGFLIEPAGPEAHWVDASGASGLDEFITWRWTVVPQRRGRRRLALMVSSQAVGHDGATSQSALPERMIEVRVGANQLRRVVRLTGWIIALAAGVLIGLNWHELKVQASASLSQLLAMLGV
jgi:hypothetical protein